jgi:hypothetical protein
MSISLTNHLWVMDSRPGALPLNPNLMQSPAECLMRMPMGKYEQEIIIQVLAQRRHAPAR